MTIFKRIKWKNLLGTGDQFTEIDLNKSPTTLIYGTNGTGKCLANSTIVSIFESEENKAFKEFRNFIKNKSLS
jgi:DNA repair exonuclease SbcCD ATPase subunit